MPGLNLFARRWSFGSDDLFFPAVYLLAGHLVWIGVTLTLLFLPNESVNRALMLFSMGEYLSGLSILWIGCVIVELTIAWLSAQGTALDTQPRSIMPYLVYVRLGMLLMQLTWHIIGFIWIAINLSSVNLPYFTVIFGLVFFDWLMMVLIFVGPSSSGCVEPRVILDIERRMCQSASCDDTKNLLYKIKPLQISQHHTVCCNYDSTQTHALADVAYLLREFLWDLDLITSDVVAGLVLLQRYQQIQQKIIIAQPSHEVYQFLSGTPITPATKFLSLKNDEMLHDYKRLIFFATYVNFTDEYRKLKNNIQSSHKVGCCSCCNDMESVKQRQGCPCSISALQKLSSVKQLDLAFASCHLKNVNLFASGTIGDITKGSGIDGVGFFIDVNHVARAIIICIHSHLCLQDAMTEIGNCNAVPVSATETQWFVHKRFLHAAVQISKCIQSNSLICYAMNKNLEKGTADYQVVVVGHSLAAGVAVLVAIILHSIHPTLHCYAFCPPSGLINAECLEGTRSFITSVVVGTDCISRFGCQQIVSMRQKVMQLLHMSTAAKWKILLHSWSQFCCQRAVSRDAQDAVEGQSLDPVCQDVCCSVLKLSPDTPKMFLPGNIIHVVRSQPKKDSILCGNKDTVYQAVLANNNHFNDLLVSPTMLSDHSPSALLEALKKLSTHVCPAKPGRRRPRQAAPNSYVPTVITTPTHQSSDFDSGFVNSAPVPIPSVQSHGIATALTVNQLPTLVRDRPCDPAVQALKRSFQLEVRPGAVGVRGEELSQGISNAPLASPEALSETSSLASFGSGSIRRQSSGGGSFGGHRRLALSQAMRMDPICQSPLCRTSTPPPARIERTQSLRNTDEGCCRRVDFKQDSCYTATQSCQDQPDTGNTIVAHQLSQDCLTAAIASSSPSPLCQTIAEVHHNVDSPTVDIQLMPMTESSVQREDMSSLAALSLDKPDISEPQQLAFSLSDTTSTVGSEDGCQCQYLYDSYVGHYSPAGRGYPHGFAVCLSPACSTAVHEVRSVISRNTMFNGLEQKPVSLGIQDIRTPNRLDEGAVTAVNIVKSVVNVEGPLSAASNVDEDPNGFHLSLNSNENHIGSGGQSEVA